VWVLVRIRSERDGKEQRGTHEREPRRQIAP